MLEDYRQVLQEKGIVYEVFDGISANPLYVTCREAARQAVQMQADMIIGLGGGSPLDAAKAVAVMAANPAMAPEQLVQKEWQKKPLPIVCLLYTSRCV